MEVFHRDQSDPSYTPEGCSEVQTGMDLLHAGPCVTILQPTSFNHSPQFIAKSQVVRSLRLLRSIPLRDRVHNQDI